jgi:hypothetical protein
MSEKKFIVYRNDIITVIQEPGVYRVTCRAISGFVTLLTQHENSAGLAACKKYAEFLAGQSDSYLAKVVGTYKSTIRSHRIDLERRTAWALQKGITTYQHWPEMEKLAS